MTPVEITILTLSLIDAICYKSNKSSHFTRTKDGNNKKEFEVMLVFENNSYCARVFSLSENKVVKTSSYPNQDSYKTEFFLSINYGRIMNLRPDYGYRNLPLLTKNEMNNII